MVKDRLIHRALFWKCPGVHHTVLHAGQTYFTRTIVWVVKLYQRAPHPLSQNQSSLLFSFQTSTLDLVTHALFYTAPLYHSHDIGLLLSIHPPQHHKVSYLKQGKWRRSTPATRADRKPSQSCILTRNLFQATSSRVIEGTTAG